MCKICHLPCCEAQQSECCGHVYCKSDINKLTAIKAIYPICPICRSEEFVTYPNISIDHEIQDLLVYCPNKDATGCDWTGKLKDVDKHYSYGKKCQTECEKCGTTVEHKLLHNHITTECPCYCPYCDITAEREVISNEHKEKCHKFPITCPNNCGLGEIPKDCVEEHKKVCPLEMVLCEFDDVGCKIEVFRKNMDCHLKENVMMHLHLTRFRLNVVNKKLEESDAKYTSTTEEISKSFSQLQERVETLENLFKNSEASPVDHDLLLKLLQSKSGVDAKVQTDGDICGRVITSTRQNSLVALKWSIITIVVAIIVVYVLSLRVTYVGSPDLPTISDYHKNISIVLYELIDKSTLPWPSKLQYWNSIATTAPVVIKLSNFSKRKNTVSYSEQFFAFQNGYKLCLKIYPYGYSEEVRGQYMSVYLHLVRGPYDEMLEKNGDFPISRDFIIELLNPREDNYHVRKVVNFLRCSDNYRKRKAEVSINPKGCGFLRFISLGKYNFESNYQCAPEIRYSFAQVICHYLSDDDALYFRVQETKTTYNYIFK